MRSAASVKLGRKLAYRSGASAAWARVPSRDAHSEGFAIVYTLVCTSKWRFGMAALKVGVREFRERIASFLESDTPVAVTRRGETLGVYVPTRRKHPKTAELSELRAAADRLAKALADVDEEELVAEFREVRRHGKRNPLR